MSLQQIRERLSDLKQEGGRLQELWLQQQQRLNQMLQFQQFLREAKMVEDMSSAHEVGMSSVLLDTLCICRCMCSLPPCVFSFSEVEK